jgi:hypothetical protein
MGSFQWMAVRVCLVVGVLWASVGAVSGETLFVATPDGSQNVPPTGSGATGTAALVLNDAQTEVEYFITYTDIEGNETGAHFHHAPPGENGDILYALPLGTPRTGTWPVTAHDVGYLLAGEVYVSIHTDLYLPGEIRGDISHSFTDVETGTASLTWSRIKALYD